MHLLATVFLEMVRICVTVACRTCDTDLQYGHVLVTFAFIYLFCVLDKNNSIFFSLFFFKVNLS